MDGHRERSLGGSLSDHVLIEMVDNVTRRWNLVEEFLRRPSTLGFLIENRLAKLDAFTTNVDVARPLDERTDIAIALSQKEQKAFFLVVPVLPRRPGTTSLPCGITTPKLLTVTEPRPLRTIPLWQKL